MRKICIIPARSGSKGLVDKNMLYMDKKPMIFHTIEAAIQSEQFKKNDIYVTTDSVEYAEIINQLGIAVVIREAELASDSATTFEFVSDLLSNFEDNVQFTLLQPTSPCRNFKDIVNAHNVFKCGSYDSVVSFSEVATSPKLVTTLNDEGCPIDIIGIDKGYRRQNSKPAYYPNGAIYISSKETYLTSKSFFTDNTKSYIMQKNSSVDVDDKDDFYHAVGTKFFDYEKREKENKIFYKKKLKELIGYANFKWLLGDSRLENLLINGYDNLSVGGITLATVVENINELLECFKPEKVFVSLGINDIITGYSIDQIKENFEIICNLFDEYNIEVACAEIVMTLYNAQVSNEVVSEINQFIRMQAKKRSYSLLNNNLELCDKYDKLNYMYTDDGLHYNDQGKELLTNSLNGFLNK